MTDDEIRNCYYSFLKDKTFPCIAAKVALSSSHVSCMVVEDMRDDSNDTSILAFLYDFVEAYRVAPKPFHSAAIIFRYPQTIDELQFDQLLWRRLTNLRTLDRCKFQHDARVDDNPESAHYSFSLKEEAFFVIGLHPASSRNARRFTYPSLVFNPHAEFERLRVTHKYESMKRAVRKREEKFSGSINPMLADFGEKSEVYQYSGVHYDSTWKCPMKKHE